MLHLRSARGLSRARNVGLAHVAAPIVAFPDDDCLYPPRPARARRAAIRSGSTGSTGSAAGPPAGDGRAVGRWPAQAAPITPDTVWHTANSHTMFLRRELVERVGAFDEALGLGARTPWSSGEETDYLVRALRLGARIEYDPSLVITHPVKPVTSDGLVALGRRDGASVGYILGAQRLSAARRSARMLVRPALGALVSLVLLDRTRARFHALTLGGRLARLSARAGGGDSTRRELGEDRRVALEPVVEREALDRALPRRTRVALAIARGRR